LPQFAAGAIPILERDDLHMTIIKWKKLYQDQFHNGWGLDFLA